jgi:transcription antitermination factor NusG
MARSGWIVVWTKPNREQWAAENLCRQGYDFYLPKIAFTKKVKGHKIATFQSLFDDYLFVNNTDNWRPISGTFGVAGIIMAGERPALLPQVEIDKLKMITQEGFVVLPEAKSKAKFEINQQVRIKDGVYSGYVGLVAGMSSRERVNVLLSGLGGKVPVLIDAGLLEAA